MSEKISIVGAGLVGSLLGLYLRQKGFEVRIFEKRKDPRNAKTDEGRSINLALSRRGILALKETGVFSKIEPSLIPMNGRLMHDLAGNQTYQPYGLQGQYINSVSRARLNKLLIESAESEGVKFHFDHKCEHVDFDNNELVFKNGHRMTSDLIIGTDGAFSTVRKHMQSIDRFNFEQHYIGHGYKELTIDPINGEFGLEPNCLHIWPRGNFMLIALPNADRTFTCTLFFPFEGNPSFDSLNSDNEVLGFFRTYFREIIDLVPDLLTQYNTNPTSSLVMTKCSPWNHKRCLLLGDSAHAIVPFYGQGMNSGFEDARLFMQMAESLDWNWDEILPSYSKQRKPDTDAISELALRNFVEMRDHVGDSNFLRRKELETHLQKSYPYDWIPLYSMVTFSDMPYSEALKYGKMQERIMKDVLSEPEDKLDFEEIIRKFKTLKQDDPIE